VKLELDITLDLVAAMAAEVKAGEEAVTAAMREAGTGLKTAWRGQITGAGLGRRLANSIRSQTYPKAGESLNAAALVWSKAPVIVGAHDTGPLIRSREGFWLAIPTEAAGRGLRGAKLTPGEWERRRGLRLRFVYRRPRAESCWSPTAPGSTPAARRWPRARRPAATRSPRRSSFWSRRSSCRSGWTLRGMPSGRTTACRG
jgi:hypothetical protein